MKIENKSGIILAYKPKNITSNDFIISIKKKFNLNKIGHAGTLDKFAEGLLIITVNKGTKFQDNITNMNKSYQTEIVPGFFTLTFDLSEKIYSKSKCVLPSKLKFENKLKTFIGKQFQVPPIFSAIKYKNKRLSQYFINNDYAKININNFKREITVFNIHLSEYKKSSIKIEFDVSKGTYIRALVRDIMLSVNNKGSISKLIRTKIGEYSITNFDSNGYKFISIQELLNCHVVKNPSSDLQLQVDKCENICVNNTINNDYLYLNTKRPAIYKKLLLNMYKFYCWDNNENH